MNLIARFPLLSYFALAYLLTWGIEVPMMLAARGVVSWHLPEWLEALAAFGPFAAAILVLGFWRGEGAVSALLNSLVHWRVPLCWWAVTLLSPFVIMCLALQLTGDLPQLLSGELLLSMSAEGKWFGLLVMGGLLRGLGEEPGWRGFALPVLRSRAGPLLATLCLWPVWVLWHLPSFLMRPEFALGAWIGFSMGMLAAAALLTLLYDRTRSVLLVAIWHALINITRGIAGSASSESFLAFAQVMLAAGVLIILYWIVFARREGTYEMA